MSKANFKSNGGTYFGPPCKCGCTIKINEKGTCARCNEQKARTYGVNPTLTERRRKAAERADNAAIHEDYPEDL